MRFQCELVSISAGFGGVSGVRNGRDLVQNAHPLVALNMFQDKAEPLLVMLKQVQHDEGQDDEELLRAARFAAQPH